MDKVNDKVNDKSPEELAKEYMKAIRKVDDEFGLTLRALEVETPEGWFRPKLSVVKK